MGNGIPDTLEELLRLYRELKQRAEDQLQGLEQDDMTAFGEASDRRNMIQETISKLDNGIGGAGDVLKEDQRVREVRKEIKAVIQQTLDVDRRMVEMASEKRDSAARDLDRLKDGRKGVRGYGKAASRRPKFVDRQG